MNDANEAIIIVYHSMYNMAYRSTKKYLLQSHSNITC